MAFPMTARALSSQWTTTALVFVAIVAILVALYRRLLPRPIEGIPYNKASARRILGDAPDMLREVGVTRELNKWLLQQVQKFQAPLCQVFVQPFSNPWLLLADPVEAQDIMMRRPDFDRSNFITDGLSPMDDFHARMKTGPKWRATRAWLQDLMAPTFLNNVVSPVMYDNSMRLVNFWKTKIELACGRPFDVNEDLNHSALDGMLAFVFDRHFDHTALGPQIDALAGLHGDDLKTGPNDEVTFPEGHLDDFIKALYQTVDSIDVVTKSISPTFAMWWIRQTSQHRKDTAVKRRVVRDQIRGALKRLETTGETRTAIEYMLTRERRTAEKQNRTPDYENPTLMDEDRLREALQTAYHAAHAEKRCPDVSEVSRTRVPYLDAVLEEALRLHATSLARQAVCDTEVLGHPVPKGTNVIVIANGPGFHSPSLSVDESLRSSTAKVANSWDETRDMAVFDPDRWLVSSASDGNVEFDANAAPQIAFGMGARSCWGKRFAYLELRMVITLIIWHFDLLKVPSPLADPKASYGIVHRADQCFLNMRYRGSA